MSTKRLRNGPAFEKPTTDCIDPLQFKLKGSDKTVTAFPVYEPSELPDSLIDFMHNEFNSVIEEGQTYPQLEEFTRDQFIEYWFASFCVVLLDTDKKIIEDRRDWGTALLGTFYIKPNYMARCSHNCNAGFMVNRNVRGKKIGFRLGQIYLRWAPLLGYKYSVFNLVFVSNPASWRIWDKLKFDRIGLVPRSAILKGIEEPVDAIIFGKDLTKVEPELLEME